MQDSTNVPAAMAIHGAPGSDVVVIDFANASAAWEADVAKRGGFSMDCNTGGGHVGGPPQICPGIWQFFEDHPFKVKPQPYPPIPCRVSQLLPDRSARSGWRGAVGARCAWRNGTRRDFPGRGRRETPPLARKRTARNGAANQDVDGEHRRR